MNKITTVIFCLLFNNNVVACVMPYSGSEYNTLVKVEKIKDKKSYSISLPKSLEGTDTAIAYLAYAKHPLKENNIAEHMVELKLTKKENTMSGQFKATVREGYAPYVHVVWPGEICNAIANIHLK